MDPLVLSIIIFSALVLAFVAVVVNEVRKKKAGKSSCGNCSGCPMSGKCHEHYSKK